MNKFLPLETLSLRKIPYFKFRSSEWFSATTSLSQFVKVKAIKCFVMSPCYSSASGTAPARNVSFCIRVHAISFTARSSLSHMHAYTNCFPRESYTFDSTILHSVTNEQLCIIFSFQQSTLRPYILVCLALLLFLCICVGVLCTGYVANTLFFGASLGNWAWQSQRNA